MCRNLFQLLFGESISLEPLPVLDTANYLGEGKQMDQAQGMNWTCAQTMPLFPSGFVSPALPHLVVPFATHHHRSHGQNQQPHNPGEGNEVIAQREAIVWDQKHLGPGERKTSV